MTDGDLTAVVRDWGLRSLSDPELNGDPAHDPETYWRTGFSFPAVRAGYAYPREAVVADLTAALADGGSRLLVGRAGAGKSTLCKLVARRWHGDRGPVYYADGDVVLGSGDPEVVAEALSRVDGQPLVVVEDALDPDRDAAVALVEALPEGEATALLETRRATVENLADRRPGEREDLVERVQRLRGDAMTDYELPGIDAEECVRIVEYYRELTGEEVVRSPEAIFREVRSARSVGGDEMVHLCYLLCDAGEDGDSGLERAVERAYERYEGMSAPAAGSDAPVGAVALAVGVCNAAGLPVRAELLHAVGPDHDAIDRAVAALTDDLLFERDDGPGYRTNHQLWSALYVRHAVVDADDGRGRRRFADCVNALLGIADEGVRREIERWLAEHGEAGADRDAADGERLVGPGIDADAPGWTVPLGDLVDRIGELGVRWPVLAPAFGTVDDDPIDLPDQCSPTTEARLLRYRGRAHALAGDLEAARGEFEGALELVERADAPAELVAKSRVRYHNDVGELDLELGDVEAAAEHFRRALEDARSVRYRRGEARSLGNLGDVARRRGDLEAATDRYRSSLETHRSVGDHQAVAESYKRLGVLAYRQGDLDDALDAYERAMAIYRDLGDKRGESDCLNNVGVVHQIRGEYDAATRHHEESMAVSRRIGEPLGVAKSRNNLGIVALNGGDPESAAEHFRESLEIKRDVGDRESIANSLGNLGRVARERGDYEAAERHHRESLEIYREVGQANERARARLNLGNLYVESDRPDEAREQFRAALEEYEDVGNELGVATCHHELGELARDRGKSGTALDHLQRAVELYVAHGDGDDWPAAALAAVELAEELSEPDRLAAVCETIAPELEAASGDGESGEAVEALRDRCGD